MPKVQAWELLNDPEHCSNLSMEQLYELLIRAGYSEEVARKASKQRGWERLQAGVEM